MLDLSGVTGFRLLLDPQTYDLHSPDGFVYRKVARTAGEMIPVLRSPGVLPGETALYYVYYVERNPPAADAILRPLHLTYGPVVLPPNVIAGEFVKTSGHYHPVIPGTSYAYPEVYTGLHGRLILLLQKRDANSPDTPLDCALIELTPGVTVTIPPDYAHVLINPTDEVAVMAGLYCTDFKPDYTDVIAHRGLAYYVMQAHDGVRLECNPRYVNPPALRRLAELDGTIFEPPDDPQTPLWTRFVQNPANYAFLSQPDEVGAFFARFETS
jgi:glucose-6-phosphate isomerase